MHCGYGLLGYGEKIVESCKNALSTPVESNAKIRKKEAQLNVGDVLKLVGSSVATVVSVNFILKNKHDSIAHAKHTAGVYLTPVGAGLILAGGRMVYSAITDQQMTLLKKTNKAVIGLLAIGTGTLSFVTGYNDLKA